MSQTTAKPDHRVAILTKGQFLVAAIALNTHTPASDGSHIHAVGSHDPRCNPAHHLRAFQTCEEAEKAFQDAITISVSHGWVIGYYGERNYG